MQKEKYHRFVKVLFVGEVAAKKSKIIFGMARKFDPNVFPPLGVDSRPYFIQYRPDFRVMLDLWDTAGEERFRDIKSHFYRGANIICCVFSFKDERSFRDISMWLKQAEDRKAESSQIILVGNHYSDPASVVTFESAQDLANQRGILFAAVNKNDYSGLDNAFISAFNSMPNLIPNPVPPPAPEQEAEAVEPPQAGCFTM